MHTEDCLEIFFGHGIAHVLQSILSRTRVTQTWRESTQIEITPLWVLAERCLLFSRVDR